MPDFKPLNEILKSMPDTVRVVDFTMGPNESNIEYVCRISEEFSEVLPKSRFHHNTGTYDSVGMEITGPEFFHLVYSIVCHMTGKY